MAKTCGLLSKLAGCPVCVGDSVKFGESVYLATDSGVVCLGTHPPGCHGREGLGTVGGSDGNSDGPTHWDD
jgi:hypothetical protein